MQRAQDFWFWMVRQFGCESASPCPEVPCLTVPVHGVMQVTAQASGGELPQTDAAIWDAGMLFVSWYLNYNLFRMCNYL